MPDRHSSTARVRTTPVIDERYAEWLTQRLDRQDYMLDQILKEQRRTNGTLLDHESRLKLIEKEDAEEAEEKRDERDRQVRRADLRARQREFAIGTVGVLFGGALVTPFAHLMHLLFA